MNPSTHSLTSHTFHGLEPGPRLIVLGAVHGNEIGGTRGIERVLDELARGDLVIVRGTVTFVPITNPLAWTLKRRAGDRNLNRNLRPVAAPQDYEDRIANVLCPLLAAHDVLLDLHSFHTGGEPFAMLGPQDNDGTLEAFSHAAAEEALALRLGARRLVEGWLDTYATGVRKRLARTAPTERAHLLSTDPDYGIGTTEYMRRMGGYAVTLECGQHDDPAAPEFAWRAIRNTLAHLKLVEAPAPAARDSFELLRLTEVIDRLHPDDQFARAWSSFDPVSAGDAIGTRHDGTPVIAPQDGYIVFPNPTSTPGNEWFYFAQRSTRALHRN
ncbi:MAG: succinylglutamate desuccinylase/aspartoacylase family protein [Methyloversatilis sp.]|uniref:succinylglutamate desuccinylase/aspartoacylase domain-containing protein n=1 Tax=Methyloversatilis sp. TaxID=2569862 RepID=UPI0027362D40|nr:succinylglutamate desuccinylase/aspartoacylase family protein [Methyloversatilis sp.]MDP3873150.1 succinylglutamate desuccinylase/aspartoacylase family protein [Methyloversatilis sp.]